MYFLHTKVIVLEILEIFSFHFLCVPMHIYFYWLPRVHLTLLQLLDISFVFLFLKVMLPQTSLYKNCSLNSSLFPLGIFLEVGLLGQRYECLLDSWYIKDVNSFLHIFLLMLFPLWFAIWHLFSWKMRRPVMGRNSFVTDGCPRHSGKAAWMQFFHPFEMGMLVPCSCVPLDRIVHI